jgi:L,D-peptidoglycan transpeptidase YkuD (ErfK/YbiS/YcfS/YnhG family)
MSRFLAAVVAFISSSSWVPAFEIPSESRQCLVGLASDWNSSRATLRLYEKSRGQWKPVGEPWSARLGKNGLVWGLGIHPVPVGASIKSEGDSRTPAGVFRIGGAWGYSAGIARHRDMPYRQVTSRDLWVEDPGSPEYNRHIQLEREPSTPWEKEQQMKQNDHAHSLKLFIAHNAGPQIRPGAGSAIFFHIWRGDGSKATSGCTTMSETNLKTLIASLDPAKKPVYVILPEADYASLKEDWKLP